MNLDQAVFLAGVLTEAFVVGLLIYRRVWRKLPVFFAYCIWDLLSNAGVYALRLYFPHRYDINLYFAETVLDSVLQFSVLVELAWSVLRPLRASLPRKALVVVAGVILAAGAAIWPFAAIAESALPSKQWYLLVQLMQTVSILRILFFLMLAGCSQLLSIGWRDRELQVATGFGFYSLISLAAAAAHGSQTSLARYSHLNELVVVSYVCSLLYWVFSFAQAEAERREFNPQMQGFLLALAGTARTTRVTLADFADANPRRRGPR